MKKLLAIILSVAMLASCIPMTVFADEPAAQDDQPEDKDIKIVYLLVSKIVESPEFQKNFKDANEFIDKVNALIDQYQDSVVGYQELAKQFVEDPVFREQCTDYLDNMIGDLDDLLILLAQETDKDLQELKAELEKIRADLVDIKDELVKLIDQLGDNTKEVEAAIADYLEEQYNIIKDYVAKLDGYIADQLKDIIDELKDKAFAFKEFTEEEIKEIIGKIKELEAIASKEFAEASEELKKLIEEAERYAKMAAEKAVQQIRADLVILKQKAEAAKEFTEEELKLLAIKLAELQEFIAFKVVEADAKIKALIEDVEEWIEVILVPALEEMIEELKAQAQAAKEYTKEQIEDLIEKAEMLQFIIASKIAEESERLQELIAEAKEWLEEAAAQTMENMIAELKALKEKTQAIKEYTEEEIKEIIEQFELLQAFIDSKIAEGCEELQELIAEAEEWLVEVAAPALEEIVAELKEKAKAIKEFTEEEIEELLIKAEELQMFIACKIAEECEELKELIVVGKKWAEKAVAKAMDQIVDVAKVIKEKIKDAVIITKEDVQKYFEKLREFKEILKKYIEVICEFDPREEIRELIEKAEAMFDETIEWMREKALDYTMKLIDDLQSGKFDWMLKPLGITGEELVDLLVDATAYAFGVMNGEGYLDLQDELATALAELDATLAMLEEAEADLDPKNPDGKVHAMVQEISNLTNQLQQISTENEQLKKQVEELVKKDNAEAEIIKKFINGYNVTKKKPTLKKVKNVKGKKVKVTFKGLKKVDATQYRINYKTGKKSKTKKWNKETSGTKTLKYTLKKLKKGKTYKIKVRGAYSFKYEGKTYTFLSKWSKTKKVKVKK